MAQPLHVVRVPHGDHVASSRSTVATNDMDLIHKLNPAHFESEILYYSEKHHKGTRSWLFDHIQDWHSKAEADNNICVITGNPGMGKSVVAAMLCCKGNQNGLLAGCFFFQHGKIKRSTPRMLVQTLAYQLCSSIPFYYDIVSEILVNTDITEMDCEQLFTHIICKPLHKLDSMGYKNKYIVIDALDECDFELQHDLVKLINNQFVEMPNGINFILTTRPEIMIMNNVRRFQMLIELSPTNPHNIKDIKLFLSDVLKHTLSQTDFEAGLNLLIQRSEGMFLYFYYAIGTLLDKNEVVSLTELESLLPAGIYDYYDQNIQRLYKTLGPDNYHTLFQAVVATRSEIPQELVAPLLQINDKDAAHVMQAVSIILPVYEGNFHVFHKSIQDWLIDKEMAGEFFVDVSRGHKNLAKLCGSIFEDISSGRILPSELNSSSVKLYAVDNIVHHFCNCHPTEDVVHQLFSVLLNLQFIYYRLIQTKGSIDFLLEDFAEATKYLKPFVKKGQQIEIDIWIKFIKRYAHQLSSMPYLIYQLALNESLQCFGVDKFASDPASFFPGISMYMEVKNKSHNVNIPLMSFAANTSLTCCIQSIDQKLIIASDAHGTIYAWNKETAQLLHTIQIRRYTCIEFISVLSASPDGNVVAFGDTHHAFNLERGNLVPLIPSTAGGDTNACAFSSDNTMLLAWSNYSDSFYRFFADTIEMECNPICTVQLWNLNSFTAKQLEITSKNGRPRFACFSHDNRYILCGHQDGRILQWESATGALRAILHTDGTVIMQQGPSPLFSREISKVDHVRHITCSPNGYYFATCSNDGIIVWDAASLTLLQKLELDCENKGTFIRSCFSSSSDCIIAGSNNGFLVSWKKKTHIEPFEKDIYVRLDDSISPIISPSVDKDMNVIYGASNSVFLQSYSSLQHSSELYKKEEVLLHPGVANQSCFLPNEGTAITCGNKSLYLWNVETNSMVTSTTDTHGCLIRLSSDGNLLLTYGDGVYIQVWDTHNLICLSTLVCSTSERTLFSCSLDPNESSPDDICHCAVSTTGTVIGGTGNGVLYLWYGEMQKKMKKLEQHQSLITYCEFSTDGSRFLSADMDGNITMWKLINRGCELEVNVIELESHQDSVEMAVFYSGVHPLRIVSCSSDYNLHLYDGSSGNFIRKMQGHSGEVMRVAVSPDGSVVASGDDRAQVIIWDGLTGELKRKCNCIGGLISDLHFLGGSDFVCTLHNEQGSWARNIIRIYDTTTGSCVSCLLFPCKIVAISTGKHKWKNLMLCTLNDGSIRFVEMHNLSKDRLIA